MNRLNWMAKKRAIESIALGELDAPEGVVSLYLDESLDYIRIIKAVRGR